MSEVASGALAEAREAFGRHEWEDAFQGLRAADADERLASEDLERMAEAARWSCHFDEMLDTFERAAAVFERDGDRRGAARVSLKLVIEHHTRNEEALAAGWFARAGKLLENEGDCSEKGFFLWCMASSVFDTGDVEQGRQLSEQVMELGKRLGDPDLEALALLEQGHALISAGDVKEGFALFDEAMASALGQELDLWTTGTVYCRTIFACRNRGDFRRAGEWSQASLRWCERKSLSGFPGLCRFHRAEIMRFRGELERAEVDVREAVKELSASGPRYAAWGLHELGEIQRRRGNLVGAADSFRQAAEHGFDPQPGLALLRLDEGNPEAARGAMLRALGDQEELARESRWLTLPAAVQAGIAAGDLELARSSLRDLEELAESLDTTAVLATADVARGRMALADSRAEDAVRDLRRGAQRWSELDAPYEVAHARILAAEAYRSLADPDSAELELHAARATLGRLGAERDVRRVDDLLSGPAQATTRATRTFMFTDICNSTKLVEVLGDQAWDAMLGWHDRTLRACFDAGSGEEVKQEGDGFFVAFPDADCALECACTIQQSLRDHRREHGFAPTVRIGLHTTEATDRGGDWGGRGVHLAARIGAAADGGEVLASREALDMASDRFTPRDERQLELKGFAEPLPVASVDWGDA